MEETVEQTQAGNSEKKTFGKSKKSKRSVVKKMEWNFPKLTLEESIELARAIEEKNGGNPVEAEDLVRMVGYNQVNDWRFGDLLRAANGYGLVKGTGAKATVSLTEIGSDIVAPSSPVQRQNALLKAFRNVKLFSDVADFYQGKKIPEDEYFSNTLTKKFEIPKDRVAPFIEVFQKNLNYLKAFAADKDGLKIIETPVAYTEQHSAIEKKVITPEKPQIREFLDTCFILMPFGEWYDRYYNDLYVPATKDAGFEPIRADGLFSTGSVMEQIWEQINKAKVLLADLTGKNPNVFYELGLSHALSKPVIFITGNLEDVPFDLRHLRVIVYDIRVPNWGELLKRDITSYLKNAKLEPEKSIPQPFRHFVKQGVPA